MSTTAHSFILTANSLVILLNSKSYVVNSSHENWDKIVTALGKSTDVETLIDLIDTAKAISGWSAGNVTVKHGQVFYKDELVHGLIVERILAFIKQNISPLPLMRFLDNLYDNPSKRSVDQLYPFLEHGNMPITPDGCFLAYKGVEMDYLDCYSKKFSNKVGAKIVMPRNAVCDDPELGCSYGFHVGSLNYATAFGKRVVIVKVNPKNTVSVPNDHGFQKLRTCSYEVFDDYSAPLNDTYYDDGSGDEYDYADYDDSDDEPIYGIKPSGDRYFNTRDSAGRFVAKKK